MIQDCTAICEHTYREFIANVTALRSDVQWAVQMQTLGTLALLFGVYYVMTSARQTLGAELALARAIANSYRAG